MKTVLIIFLAAAALAITVFAVTNRRGFSALILNAIGGAAALFAVTSAGMMFACGWFGKWCPHEIEGVASFFITFLAIFALAAVGYGIYFKKTAGSYDAALARYREQNRR